MGLGKYALMSLWTIYAATFNHCCTSFPKESHALRMHHRKDSRCSIMFAPQTVPAVNGALVHAPPEGSVMRVMRSQGQVVDRKHVYVAAVFFAVL